MRHAIGSFLTDKESNDAPFCGNKAGLDWDQKLALVFLVTAAHHDYLDDVPGVNN